MEMKLPSLHDLCSFIITEIVRSEKVCVSTELKWKLAEYGFYHDYTADIADNHKGLDQMTAPELNNKKLYIWKQEKPTENQIKEKVQIYKKIFLNQQDNTKCGLFAQSVLTIAFWRAYVDSRLVIERLGESLHVSSRVEKYLDGRTPELDIFYVVSRGVYGADVKNKMEMQTPLSQYDSRGRPIIHFLDACGERGIRPSIFSPLSSIGLKTLIFRKRSRPLDYLNLILLQTPEIEDAFSRLNLKQVWFLPKIDLDGEQLDGKEFFQKIRKVIDKKREISEILSLIEYDSTQITELIDKAKGLFVLSCLYDQMLMTGYYGSQIDTLKRAIAYMTYQYVSADENFKNVGRVHNYLRRQKSVSQGRIIHKYSRKQSSDFLDEQIDFLADSGILEVKKDQVRSSLGKRPESFLYVNKKKIRSDFGI